MCGRNGGSIAVPTTSALTASVALDGLRAAGIDFAILHKESDLSEGRTPTDVDLVVDRPSALAVLGARRHWEQDGLFPIVLWPYDLGTLTVFLVNETADEGVQLDLMFDPEGRGRYAVRTPELLARSRPGRTWPTLAPDDELLYRLRKRLCKKQFAAVSEIVAEVQSRGRPAEARCEELFTPAAARGLRRVIAGSAQGRSVRVGRAMSSSVRIGRRLRNPIGMWVHVEGDDARRCAEALAQRFDRVLLTALAAPTRTGISESAFWARHIAPVRWRAGLALTWGDRPRLLRPDISVVYDGSTSDAARSLVLQARDRAHP
jgi:hypothetical protein